MTTGDILVLGIGNLLWADEGFGVRAVQALHREWRLPPQVTVMDGGTLGLGLLPHVQAARRLIVFDAIDCDLPPATLKVLACKDVPRSLGPKRLSLHQTGFQDILAYAELAGSLPDEVVIIGVQPVCLDDYGGGLHPAVQARMAEAIEIAIGNLMRWGCEPVRRDEVDSDAVARDPACASPANAVCSFPL